MIEKLAELGFTNATVLGNKGGKTLVRIRTSQGWSYERFGTVDDVVAWARARTP